MSSATAEFTKGLQHSTAFVCPLAYNGCGVIRMKFSSKEIIRAAIVGFVIPGILLHLVVALAHPQETVLPTGSAVTLPQPTLSTTEPTKRLFLPVLVGESVEQMDLEQYLLGVLLSEIPAEFEPEALKAQAVAARTYALKCHVQGYKHAGAICTVSSCCQGYITEAEYLEAGGKKADIAKMLSAVKSTEGQVLCYDGKLILATYFDSSGGMTEDAAAVWGQVYPYLQAVPSPGETASPNYETEKSFTQAELEAALGCTLGEDAQQWFSDPVLTPGNGVESMCIGGVTYKGTTLRSLLGLRSTAFTVEVRQEQIVFRTRGFGHRVGLSQYGAEAMAVSGSTYAQILAHYYPGAELTLLEAGLEIIS